MPLYFFYTMVQKSQKSCQWPKTQIKGGVLPARIAGEVEVRRWQNLNKTFRVLLTVGHLSPSPIGYLGSVDDRGCAGEGTSLAVLVRDGPVVCPDNARTFVCVVIRDRLVQVRQNLKNVHLRSAVVALYFCDWSCCKDVFPNGFAGITRCPKRRSKHALQKTAKDGSFLRTVNMLDRRTMTRLSSSAGWI